MSNHASLLHVLNNVGQAVAMLGVRLDEQLEARLNALAEKKNRSKSYLAKEALKRYIEEEESREYEKANPDPLGALSGNRRSGEQ